MKQIPLREVAHSRSGEKGRDCNISVIAYDPDDYALIADQITVSHVKMIFGKITKGDIARFEVPSIAALNFVVSDVLEGGRSRTLVFDESGKALSSLMMELLVEVPDNYVGRAERVKAGVAL